MNILTLREARAGFRPKAGHIVGPHCCRCWLRSRRDWPGDLVSAF